MRVAVAFLAAFTMAGEAAVAQRAPMVTPEEPIAPASEFKHALNMCPIALVFGIVSVNYEYLHNNIHGLVARIDYEAVPGTYSDAAIDASGKGVILNYRHHVSGGMNSIYLGVYARYRVYRGTGVSGVTPFDATVSERTLGLNIGKRWSWNSGFNITFGLGYGLSNVSESAEPTDAAIAAAVSAFQDEYNFFNPSYGELSIGYAF